MYKSNYENIFCDVAMEDLMGYYSESVDIKFTQTP
jgi:hypothetical protein